MKSDATISLEREIWRYTQAQGVFGCNEVTIGFFGHERVDYMTYDTDGVVRCYEIKISKSDFRSKAAATFIGHFNYYVLPLELYNEIRDDIPVGIGVYVQGQGLVKKARRQELRVSHDVIKDSLIRSLYREYQKWMRSEDQSFIQRLKREIAEHKASANYYDKKCDQLLWDVLIRFGRNWREQPKVYNESGRMSVGGEE